MELGKKQKRVCEHCGASMMEYRHSLSKGLLAGLAKLNGAGGGPINLGALGLTRNQWDNFQKLRYWNLVAKHMDDEGRRKGGVWKITDAGREFLRGGSVAKSVWTYRGERVRFEGAEIRAKNIDPGYEYRKDYAKVAQPAAGTQNLGKAEQLPLNFDTGA